MSLAKTVESARAALTAGQKPHGWQWFELQGFKLRASDSGYWGSGVMV